MAGHGRKTPDFYYYPPVFFQSDSLLGKESKLLVIIFIWVLIIRGRWNGQ